MFRIYIETTETNRTVSKQTKTTLNFMKNTQICSLTNCFGWPSVCFGLFKTRYRSETTETNCLETNQKTEINGKRWKKWKNPKFSDKNTKKCSLSNCFGWSSVCFGSIKTSKLYPRSFPFWWEIWEADPVQSVTGGRGCSWGGATGSTPWRGRPLTRPPFTNSKTSGRSRKTWRADPVSDWDFFGPKWLFLRSLPFQGSKKSRFSGPTPSNGPCNPRIKM